MEDLAQQLSHVLIDLASWGHVRCSVAATSIFSSGEFWKFPVGRSTFPVQLRLMILGRLAKPRCMCTLVDGSEYCRGSNSQLLLHLAGEGRAAHKIKAE